MEIGNEIFRYGCIREILFNLYGKKNKVSYAMKISKDILITYSNVLSVIPIMEEIGLIKIVKKQGNTRALKYQSKRTKFYGLTDKGIRITKLLLKIDEELNGGKDGN